MSTLESCVLCDEQLTIPKKTHIHSRDNYIEGAGQLCYSCFNKTYEKPAFTRKNYVTCRQTPMWKVMFEYICWFLAGKPKEYNERHK